MPLTRRPRPDPELLGLFDECGRNVQRASLILRDLLADYPERAALARDMLVIEQEGDRIVPREELYETVWGAPLRTQDRSVDVYVHKLRTKLAEALPEWGFIHTHFGFGYRLAAEHHDINTFSSHGVHKITEGA